MKKMICLVLTLISISAFAGPMPYDATLISETTENGIVTRTYVMESHFDEYEYCYQQIIVKKTESTGALVSSDSTEHCRRIR
jgi:hypothetical protein